MKDVGDEEQECSKEWNFSLRFSLTLSDIRKLSLFRPLLASSSATSRLEDLLYWCETADCKIFQPRRPRSPWECPGFLTNVSSMRATMLGLAFARNSSGSL